MAITIKRQLGQSQDGGDRLLKRRQERKSTADCDTCSRYPAGKQADGSNRNYQQLTELIPAKLSAAAAFK